MEIWKDKDEKNLDNEIWKTIEYFSDYAVSNMGRIKRIKKSIGNNSKIGRILSQQKDKIGYLYIGLYKNGKYFKRLIHRLILETFKPVENMDKLEGNHKKGIKSDNRLSELEWNTKSENEKHAHNLGLKNLIGSKNNNSKLTEKEVIKIKKLLNSEDYKSGKINQKYIASIFNIKSYIISQIKTKMSWSYIKI